jgi:hypothetical protein
MLPSSRLFLTVAVLSISVGLWSQEPLRDLRDNSDVLARLSYDSSSLAQGGHFCFAVSPAGDYRFVRSINSVNGGLPVRLQGKMTKEQLQQLKALLESSEFRHQSGNHGGVIREEAESFGAEIPAPDPQGGIEISARRLQWLNADGESPFPASVAKVVKWLKEFEPTGGKSFEYAEFPDVCPSGGLHLLHPSVAQSLHP